MLMIQHGIRSAPEYAALPVPSKPRKYLGTVRLSAKVPVNKILPVFGRVVLVIGFALVLVAMRPQGARAANWYNSSWTYRQKITIDTSKVAGSATSFPVLISRTN